MTQIYLRPARLADRDTIMQIIDEAKAAMKRAGSPQWQDGHPNITMITEDITKQIGWILMVDQQVAGYVAMQLTPDPTYQHIANGHWANPTQPYATFHRVVISEHFRGHHLGQFLMSNLLTLGLAKGITNFRLDTHPVNAAMQGLAKSCGFALRGDIEVNDKIDPHRLAFELNLAQPAQQRQHVINDFMKPLLHHDN
ncbi:MAG: GNAT family N-acetyltransferase [Limosilactobacillus sp.]